MYTYAPGPEWSLVTQSLQKSLYAEQMVCSMSTQLFHIPETENLQGNREMHEHLVRASYHRVTATGSAVRLQTGRIMNRSGKPWYPASATPGRKTPASGKDCVSCTGMPTTG